MCQRTLDRQQHPSFLPPALKARRRLWTDCNRLLLLISYNIALHQVFCKCLDLSCIDILLQTEPLLARKILLRDWL